MLWISEPFKFYKKAIFFKVLCHVNLLILTPVQVVSFCCGLIRVDKKWVLQS